MESRAVFFRGSTEGTEKTHETMWMAHITEVRTVWCTTRLVRLAATQWKQKNGGNCMCFFFWDFRWNTPWKTKNLTCPLKINGWKMYFLYRNRSFFVEMLVLWDCILSFLFGSFSHCASLTALEKNSSMFVFVPLCWCLFQGSRLVFCLWQ